MTSLDKEEERVGSRLVRIPQSFPFAVFICIKLVMTFQVSLGLKCVPDHLELSLLVRVALLTSRGSF